MRSAAGRARDARGVLPWVALLVLAAALLLWELGTSSLFVDEVYSYETARLPRDELLDSVRARELAPATYYLGLHYWMVAAGSEAEWVMRLPSALAGIALVGVVAWVAHLVAGRRGALVAGALTALSPLVLEYAQQVRAYAFAMLLVTVAVGAALEAERSAGRRRAWLAGAAVAAAAALNVHYTAALVVAPLAVWVATRRAWPGRERLGFAAVAALAWLATLPLLLDQLERNGSALADIAVLNVPNVLNVLGTPFDGRDFDEGFELWLGAAVTVGSLLWLSRPRAGGGVAHRRLLLAAAALAPAVVLVVALFGRDVVISRYTAVAAPLLVVAIAVAIASLPARAAAALALGAFACAAVGTVQAHRTEGRYLDTRAAVGHVRAGYREGDVLAAPPEVGLTVLAYYAAKRVPGARLLDFADREGTRAAIRERRRLWIVRAGRIAPRAEIDAYLEGLGYRARDVRAYPARETLQLVLAVPRGPSAAPGRSGGR
jgi:4-amino-4-deoxy-L-arabinose transferase-like glycosyltransferase